MMAQAKGCLRCLDSTPKAGNYGNGALIFAAFLCKTPERA